MFQSRLFLAVAIAGIVVMTFGVLPAPAASTQDKNKQAEPALPAGKDYFGDPLPSGAQARLGSLRRLAAVFSVAFSPDNKLLAVAGEQALMGQRLVLGPGLRVYDLAKGEALRGFDTDSWISQIAFSANGKTLAALAGKSRIVFWDVASGARLRQEIKLAKESTCFSFIAADDKTSITRDKNDMLVFRDAASGHELCRLGGKISGMAQLSGRSNDGKLRVAVREHWSLYTQPFIVRDLVGDREIDVWGTHQDAITCLVYSPDGQTVASGSQDCTIRLWEAATGKPLRVLAGHQGTISALAFAADGKTLASAGEDQVIRVWETATGRERAKYAGHAGKVLTLAFAASGQQVLAAGTKGTLYNCQQGKSNLPLVPENLSFARAAMSADATVLGAMLADGQLNTTVLRLWRLPATQGLWDLTLAKDPEYHTCWAVTVSRDGGMLATSESFFAVEPALHGVRLWEVASGREILHMGGQFSFKAVAISPDNRFLAAGFGGHLGHGASLWDLASGRRIQLEGHTGPVTCLAFSPDSQTLVTGSSDRTLLTWKIGHLPGRLPSDGLSAKDLKKYWADLGGMAPEAYRASWKLAAAPEATLPFLREHLRPIPRLQREQIVKLIANLDSDQFVVREKAMSALGALGSAVGPDLRRALAGNIALEARRRIERLLAKLDGRLVGEDLRAWRAVAVLERIGTVDARRLLQSLARGEPGSLLAQESQAALDRLARRK